MGGEHKHEPDRKQSHAADHDPTSTPGKSTQVQATATAKQITGLDSVDKFKERRKAPGNFLSETERIQLEREYERYLSLGIHNGRDATLNVCIDLASAKNTGGLGGLFDLAYRFITDWITGGVLSKVARWTGADKIFVRGVELTEKEANWIRKHVTDAAVKSTLVSGWMGLRTVFKDMSMAHPNNWTEVSFLRSSIQEGFTPIVIDMMDQVPLMKDGQLAAMTHAMKASAAAEFSIPAWTQIILDKLDRFGKQQIDDVGQSRSMQQTAHKELVNVVGQQPQTSRAAIVEYYDPNTAFTHKMYDGKYVDVEQPQFVSWVDDDLYEAAEKRNQERNHRKGVRTVDARKATGMKEIDQWAAISITPIPQDAPAVAQQ